MCGIAGLIHFDGAPVRPEDLSRMSGTLAHRGPDGEGTYVGTGIGLAHRRLSIIDLSSAGHQPMANEDGTVWLTYNGEIYNFLELRRHLEGCGHAFRSATDSEVIVHAYEEWGLDCVSRFNGMFAFALWDERLRRLWLVRDRIGVKPLFYATFANGLAFGSEAKAVLAQADRRLDYEALQSYLAFNYVPAPRTLFAGVRQVLPGHSLLIGQDGAITSSRYWELTFTEDGRGSEAEYREELSALLADSVRLRLRADVPFGAFLSGGVDSSGVAHWMASELPDPVRTFSVGFGEPSYDEIAPARVMARACGSDHREQTVTADAAAASLHAIVRHAEEPTADSSMVALYALSRLARQDVKMVLTGDGADELFAGYETYQAHYLHRAYRWIPSPLRALIGAGVDAVPVSDAKMSWESKARRFVAAGEMSSDDAHASWRTIFDPGLRRRLLAPADHGGEAAAEPLDVYRAAFARTNARHPLNRMLYVDTSIYLPSDMLVKVDRMTMAHGLEAREPYLDVRLVEFAARLPVRFKLKALRHKKYLLKTALSGKVPPQLLARSKQGFNMPMPRWIRGGLRALACDLLSPARVRSLGFLDPGVVSTILEAHLRGDADNSHQIWGLMVLVAWHGQFLGAEVAA